MLRAVSRASRLRFKFRSCVTALAPAALLFVPAQVSAQPASIGLPPKAIQSLVTPVAVFGSDGRQPISSRHADLLQKVGTLTLDGSTICTAFCVAPDLVATASHCLFGTAGSPKASLTRFAFKVGNGQRRQTSRIAGTSNAEAHDNVRSGTENLGLTPPIEAANDWAVARLAQPACRAGGLPLSNQSQADVRDAASAGKVFQAAMHRDLSPTKIVVSSPCAIKTEFPDANAAMISRDFADADSIMLHDCDTGPGSSGSPMLIDSGDGPEVIGINVGTYVLSRVLDKTAGSGGSTLSEPIANTAVEAERFRGAIEELRLLPDVSLMTRLKPAGLPAR